MTEKPIKCGTCDGLLALSEPSYVHADGNTYRHRILPVPADGTPPTLATGGTITAEDNVALNAIADALTARFGFLPLSVRYGAATKALRMARVGYSLHGDWDTEEPPNA